MYRFKKEKKDEIISRFKLSYIANEIGISLTYLSNVLNSKVACKKVVAYCITKNIDAEKEIEYFFENE